MGVQRVGKWGHDFVHNTSRNFFPFTLFHLTPGTHTREDLIILAAFRWGDKSEKLGACPKKLRTSDFHSQRPPPTLEKIHSPAAGTSPGYSKPLPDFLRRIWWGCWGWTPAGFVQARSPPPALVRPEEKGPVFSKMLHSFAMNSHPCFSLRSFPLASFPPALSVSLEE